MANESVSVNDLFQSIFPQAPTDTGTAEQEAPAPESARLGGPTTPYDDLIYKLATAREEDLAANALLEGWGAEGHDLWTVPMEGLLGRWPRR